MWDYRGQRPSSSGAADRIVRRGHRVTKSTKFDASYFARLDGARHHWWVSGMRSVAAALLGNELTQLDVLDAGMGTGSNIELVSRLAGGRRIRGMDLAWPAVVSCATRYENVDVIQASVASIPFRDEVFDLVLCMDVLQHLPRSEVCTAIVEMRRVMRRGGRLLLRTGAAFGHRHVVEYDDWRLYQPEDLSSIVRDSGLRELRTTYANSLPGLWASLPRPWRHHVLGGQPRQSRHEEEGLGIPTPAPQWKSAAFRLMFLLESRWLQQPRHRVPFGHSIYVLAEKV
jgi:SAM-dependent methyltransferase